MFKVPRRPGGSAYPQRRQCPHALKLLRLTHVGPSRLSRRTPTCSTPWSLLVPLSTMQWKAVLWIWSCMARLDTSIQVLAQPMSFDVAPTPGAADNFLQLSFPALGHPSQVLSRLGPAVTLNYTRPEVFYSGFGLYQIRSI